MFSDIFVRIFAVGNDYDECFRICRRDYRQCTHCCTLPGRIAVVAEYGFFGVSFQQFDVLGSEGGSERRHDIFDARACQGNCVHISFNDDDEAAAHYLLPRAIQTEKNLSFVEDARFRRIQILGSVDDIIQNSAAECDHMPRRIGDRNHDPIAKTIVDTGAASVLYCQTRLQQLLVGNAALFKCRRQFIPTAGRKTEAEVFNRLLIYPASGEILQSFRAVRREHQAVVKESRRHFVDF